ncbi:hypothetical protein [Coralloluteibacterium thermophilus]|uniref:DUF3618 domain-containing protein n=1 Tax=Coralloluteibacterium thermophilum TaxID=2707049 RepID=A0ABV9NMD1_9GAMM
MSDLSREEVKAHMAASEAKVSATLEVMRRENAEARAELRAAVDAERVDAAQLRADIRTALSEMAAASASQSHKLESKISGLKIWVLSGALAGVVALLTVLGNAYLRSMVAAEVDRPAVPAVQQAPARPDPPADRNQQ